MQFHTIETKLGTLLGTWITPTTYEASGDLPYRGKTYEVFVRLYWKDGDVAFVKKLDGRPGVYDCIWDIMTPSGRDAQGTPRAEIGNAIRVPIMEAMRATHPAEPTAPPAVVVTKDGPAYLLPGLTPTDTPSGQRRMF